MLTSVLSYLYYCESLKVPITLINLSAVFLKSSCFKQMVLNEGFRKLSIFCQTNFNKCCLLLHCNVFHCHSNCAALQISDVLSPFVSTSLPSLLGSLQFCHHGNRSFRPRSINILLHACSSCFCQLDSFSTAQFNRGILFTHRLRCSGKTLL